MSLLKLVVRDHEQHVVFELPSVDSTEVYLLAERKRPPLGSTSITVSGESEKRAVTYRRTDHLDDLRRRYHGPGTRRLSNKQIEAAACRFEADDEYDNAMNMLALRQ